MLRQPVNYWAHGLGYIQWIASAISRIPQRFQNLCHFQKMLRPASSFQQTSSGLTGLQTPIILRHYFPGHPATSYNSATPKKSGHVLEHSISQADSIARQNQAAFSASDYFQLSTGSSPEAADLRHQAYLDSQSALVKRPAAELRHCLPDQHPVILISHIPIVWSKFSCAINYHLVWLSYPRPSKDALGIKAQYFQNIPYNILYNMNNKLIYTKE